MEARGEAEAEQVNLTAEGRALALRLGIDVSTLPASISIADAQRGLDAVRIDLESLKD